MMNKLVATTLESKFHVFDVRTQHPKKGFASLSEKVNCSNVSKLPYYRELLLIIRLSITCTIFSQFNTPGVYFKLGMHRLENKTPSNTKKWKPAVKSKTVE